MVEKPNIDLSPLVSMLMLDPYAEHLGFFVSMEQEEIWKDVKGYEGLYVVSNLGRVKRLPVGKQWPSKKTHNNIRKQALKNGYLCVNLSKQNKVKWFGVHRLAATAFIPNPNNYPHVNHIDENKTNNRVDNLEWCTQSQNKLHGTAIKRQNETRHKNDPYKVIWKAAAMKHAKRVSMYDKESNEIIKTYDSITDAAKYSGDNICTIINQCKGYRKSRKKHYWKYD